MRLRRRRAVLSAALAVAAAAPIACASASSDILSTNATSGFIPGSPTVRLPWVLLAPEADALSTAQDDACLGLQISPRAALLAASCVQRYQAAHNLSATDPVGSVAVALAHDCDVEVADFTRSQLRWRRREHARATLHPEFSSEPLAFDVALVQWDDRIDALVPVILDSSMWSQDGQSAAALGAEAEYEATARRWRTSVCPSGVECIEATWGKQTSCVAVQQLPGVVYRTTDDRSVVSGLIVQTLDCAESDAVSASPTQSHATVTTLANVRSFIDATVRDVKWAEPDSDASSGSSESGDAPVVGDGDVPAFQDGSLGDSSAASESSTDEDVGEVGVGEYPAPVVQVWRTNLMDKFGYLSRREDLPGNATQLVEGGIAVIIAPQFLVTRASWIRGLDAVQWVYLASQVIAIKRVVSQDAQDQENRLVVVELEHAIDDASYAWVEIPTTLPPKYTDLRALVTMPFMGDAFVTTEYNALDDRALCGLPENSTGNDDDDALVCVTGSERASLYMGLLPFNASFLFMDQFLVGLSRGLSISEVDLRVAQAYEPLGASRSARSFLDEATNGTVVWTGKDVYVVPPDPFIVGETLLYSNGTSSKDSLLPCGVVPLTTRFFLTMASCLGGRDVAWVVYRPAEEPTPSPVDEGEIVELNPLVEDFVSRKHTIQKKKPDEKKNTNKKNKATRTPTPSLKRRHDHFASNAPQNTPSKDTSWRPKGALAVSAVHLHPIYEATQAAKYDFAIIECAEDVDVGGFSTVRLMGEILAAHKRVVEHRLGSDSSEDGASLVVGAAECVGANAETNGAVCVAATASSPRCRTKETESPTTQPAASSPTQSLFHRIGVEVMFVGFFTAPGASDDACDARRAYSQVANIMNFINAIVVNPEWGTSRPETSSADYKEPPFAALKPVETPAPPHRPYVVGLRLTKSGQNFCGGSLIAPQFVLTAAHCVTDGVAAWVAVGSSLSAGLDTEPIPIDKARTRIHPQYQSPFAYSHDAAILELAVPAYEASVPLDTSRDFIDGVRATMFGYGVESASSSTLSPVLHAREVALLSRATCARALPNIDDAVVCALAPSGLDACTGDSGSPLVVADAAAPGGERLVGVVSAGYGCGVAGVPGLYTRVASIAEFVNAYAVSPIWLGGGGGGAPEEIDDEVRTRPPTPTPAGTGAATPGATSSPSGAGASGSSAGTSNGGAGASQSTTTDVSQLPLEDRNASPNGSAAARPAAVGGSQLTRANATGGASSAFVAAVRRTPLPADSLTALTKVALLQFLLGDYPYSFVPPQLLDALASPANAVTFFSSGDVRPLLIQLTRHESTPLNQRRDRFQSATRRPRPEAAASRCSAVTSP